MKKMSELIWIFLKIHFKRFFFWGVTAMKCHSHKTKVFLCFRLLYVPCCEFAQSKKNVFLKNVKVPLLKHLFETRASVLSNASFNSWVPYCPTRTFTTCLLFYILYFLFFLFIFLFARKLNFGRKKIKIC